MLQKCRRVKSAAKSAGFVVCFLAILPHEEPTLGLYRFSPRIFPFPLSHMFFAPYVHGVHNSPRFYFSNFPWVDLITAAVWYRGSRLLAHVLTPLSLRDDSEMCGSHTVLFSLQHLSSRHSVQQSTNQVRVKGSCKKRGGGWGGQITKVKWWRWMD